MMPSIAAPHLLQDWNMRLPALQTHIPRSHGRQERDLRPAARLLTASVAGEVTSAKAGRLPGPIDLNRIDRDNLTLRAECEQVDANIVEGYTFYTLPTVCEAGVEPATAQSHRRIEK